MLVPYFLRFMFSGMWCHVTWLVVISIVEELAAFVFRVTGDKNHQNHSHW